MHFDYSINIGTIIHVVVLVITIVIACRWLERRIEQRFQKSEDGVVRRLKKAMQPSDGHDDNPG